MHAATKAASDAAGALPPVISQLITYPEELMTALRSIRPVLVDGTRAYTGMIHPPVTLPLPLPLTAPGLVPASPLSPGRAP